ncbi:hypothetical protein NBRC116494_27100 [Aurantivibrio plasticivorans]
MKFTVSVALLAFAGYSLANDVSPAGSMYITQITQGGATSMRDAARSIASSRNSEVAVLDVLAEAMLVHYKNEDKAYADAVAWSCKGLAASGNGRYYSAIEQAANDAWGRNTRKHCSKAAKQIGAASGEQYSAGKVSLQKATQKAAKNMPKAEPKEGKSPITDVQVGMSMEQAYNLAGVPDNTTTYQTGKAWRPFNFKGADNYRTAALYKGQGRIVFSNDNQYSNNMKVLEVIVNPSETGYP